jgi:ParB/RepB/Spo0J family partition protein
VKSPTILPDVVSSVELKHIHPDPDQPRRSFDEASLLALADNIRARGIQQPLLVRKVGGSTGLMIVDGERRWRAAKVAGLKSVPALLVDDGTYEEGQLRLDQVSVNQLREQLKPMDLARVLRGLRDAGKTTNDIAATLAKQGLPAMKPAAIEQMTVLTDLPDWLQGMVNAEEIEPGPAAELAPLLAVPAVEKGLRKRLPQKAGYTGSIDGRNVQWEVAQVLKEVFVDLTRVDSWSGRPAELVHFKWKVRCKGCEHLQRWGDGAFCRNRKQFEEHNQEAKDSGLLPGGKRPEKPKAVEDKAAEKEAAAKAEQRDRSLGEKARDYLHARLCVALIEELPKRPHLTMATALWRALKSPGSRGTRGAQVIDSRIPPEYHSLEQLVGEMVQADLERAALDAALNIINELPWREVHALARLIWGNDLRTVWNLDRQFLDLFRKAELVHLAGVHGCELPEGRRSWEALKGDEIKDALLSQHDKLLRPAILADLYQGEIEPPYKPWRGFDEGNDGEEADDGGPYFEQGEDDERDAA